LRRTVPPGGTCFRGPTGIPTTSPAARFACGKRVSQHRFRDLRTPRSDESYGDNAIGPIWGSEPLHTTDFRDHLVVLSDRIQFGRAGQSEWGMALRVTQLGRGPAPPVAHGSGARHPCRAGRRARRNAQRRSAPSGSAKRPSQPRAECHAPIARPCAMTNPRARMMLSYSEPVQLPADRNAEPSSVPQSSTAAGRLPRTAVEGIGSRPATPRPSTRTAPSPLRWRHTIRTGWCGRRPWMSVAPQDPRFQGRSERIHACVASADRHRAGTSWDVQGRLRTSPCKSP
jgi:hypothetical protein